ncbi:MAG: hypothetical protein H6537_11985 [Bacteroidales bacterium]|nr:hypothetical protein [Bacteroidales bacterium]
MAYGVRSLEKLFTKVTKKNAFYELNVQDVGMGLCRLYKQIKEIAGLKEYLC